MLNGREGGSLSFFRRAFLIDGADLEDLGVIFSGFDLHAWFCMVLRLYSRGGVWYNHTV